VTRPLRVTGVPAADALLNRNGTALLIGMLLDQQVTMEWAFTGPWTLRKRLGHLDAARIARMRPDAFVRLCCEKPAIHRYPASMATRIQALCAVLVRDHGGRGANVWRGVRDGDELHARVRRLPGFGEEKTQVFVALLAKRFGVRPRGWKRAAGVYSDAKPRSIADVWSPASLAKVRKFYQ
jgi:uncharacterized HhH-GPD family protein